MHDDHRTLFEQFYGDTLPIAVIGAGCRFPRAADIFEYWRRLADGVELIERFGPERLAAAGLDPGLLERLDYVPVGATLEDVDRFEWEFFGYSRKEAEAIDPQQRVFLMCAWEALEMAGYRPGHAPAKVGVIGASKISTYAVPRPEDIREIASPLTFQKLIGNDKDYLATRVSYKLDLTGPSLTVQTACSSSLVAIHLACEQLASGECDMALAGGVGIAFPQESGYFHREGMIFSPDGRCRPFDARAQGTTPGNGAAVVLLKPLDRALADGDPILAVVRGSAVNNDGHVKAGYTAPSCDGQVRVISDALEIAGIDPATIQLVEAHGTATPLGDPIEVEALTRAFRARTAARQTCAIGSVKSNLGHLDTAAGVASFLKAALAVHYGQIPPSLHFERPNPAIDLAASPFYVPQALLPWPEAAHPRRAAVSSFGIGGTNSHGILEQAPAPLLGAPRPSRGPACALALSARSESALRTLALRHAAQLTETDAALDLADYCATSLHHRSLFAHRLGLVASSAAELADLLHAFAEGADPRFERVRGEPGVEARVACAPSAREDRLVAVVREQLGRARPAWGDHLPPPARRQLLPVCPFEGQRCFRADEAPRAAAPPASPADAAWGALVQGGRAAAVELAASLDLSGLPEEAAGLDALHAIYVGHAFERLGAFTGPAPEAWLTVDECLTRGGIPDRYRDLCGRLLRDLCAAGVLRERATTGERAYGELRPRPLAEAERWLGRMRDLGYGHLASLIERVGPELDRMLTGKVDPVSVVFPGAATDDVEHMYQGQPYSVYLNGVAARAAAAHVGALGRPARILEVGAGTGGTTGGVLAALPPGQCAGYTFTDVGPLFVQRAQQRFAAHPFVDYAVFDMERPAAAQRLPHPRYDVIVAANVVHNAHDLRRTLGNLRGLLAPGGVLLMREIAAPKKLFDFVFGPLVPPIGDTAARGGELFPSLAAWRAALADAGFARCEAFPGEDLAAAALGEHIIAAQAPGGGSAAALAAAGLTPGGGSAVALAAAGRDGEGRARWTAGQIARAALARVPSAARATLEDLRWHADPAGAADPLRVEVHVTREGVQVEAAGDGEPRQTLFTAALRRPRALPAAAAVGGGRGPCRATADGTLLDIALAEVFGDAAAWPGRVDRLHWPAPDAESGFLHRDERGGAAVTDAEGRAVLALHGASAAPRLPAPWRGTGGLYRWRWAPWSPPSPPAREARVVWIAEPQRPDVAAILHAFARQGSRCTVYPSAALASDPEGFRAWLAAQGPVDLVCYEPVVAAGADQPAACVAEQQALLGPALALLPVLAATAAPPRLAVLARDAFAVADGDAVAGWLSASLAGLLAVASHEYPALAPLLLDAGGAAADDLVRALLSAARDGEPVVALRGGGAYAARVSRAELSPSRPLSAGRHVLIGGLSELGLAVARWLVAQGARDLVILARRELDARTAAVLASLEAQGAKVAIDPRADAADPEAFAAALGALAASGEPIGGVFHLAGVVRDAPLATARWDDFAAALAPKLVSALLLHAWEDRLRPAFTAYFSSAATVFGPPRQGAHAAANALLESLAERRSRLGMDTVALAWGYWGEIESSRRAALSARLAEHGMKGLPTEQGLALLGAALGGDAACYAPLHVDWAQLAASGPHGGRDRLFSELLAAAPPRGDAAAGRGAAGAASAAPAAPAAPAAAPAEPAALARALLREGAAARPEHARRYLRARISTLLRCDEAAVTDDGNLIQLGLDSLLFLELSETITRELGVRVSAETALSGGTLAALADGLARELGGGAPRAEGGLRAALLELEQAEGGWLAPNGDVLCRPEPGPGDAGVPLTGLRRMRWLQREEGVTCHLYVEYDKPASFDLDALERAWNRLVARHPLMRATVGPDALIRVLPEAPRYVIPRIELRGLPAPQREKEREALRASMSRHSMDLSRWPHFDLRASRADDATLRLHLDIDTTLIDIESFQIILRELYTLVREPRRALPELAFSPRDYLLAEAALRRTQAYAAQWAAHAGSLAGLPPPPDLPLARLPSELGAPRFSTWRDALPRATWLALKGRAEALGLTGTAVLLAAYGLALAQWAPAGGFSVRLGYTDRRPLHAQAMNIVVDASAAMPVPLALGGAPSFTALARACHEAIAARLGLELVDSAEALREYGRRALAPGHPAGSLPIAFTSLLGVREDYAVAETSDPLLGMPAYEYGSYPHTWLHLQALEEESALLFNVDALESLFPEELGETVLLGVRGVLETLAHVEAAWELALAELLPQDPEIAALARRARHHLGGLPAGGAEGRGHG
ncbi:beta-ketoacyl synthase N-terminal-like domain-containing protein [Sorangium sp. So ce861]|uniref:beta-ketoacyl synthase N-terminal-like domain-containing protein n=1 Tax=Sorangium sp. So ce861 TaxID=3133323 RepID=UPI003F5DE5BA